MSVVILATPVKSMAWLVGQQAMPYFWLVLASNVGGIVRMF